MWFTGVQTRAEVVQRGDFVWAKDTATQKLLPHNVTGLVEPASAPVLYLKSSHTCVHEWASSDLLVHNIAYYHCLWLQKICHNQYITECATAW